LNDIITPRCCSLFNFLLLLELSLHLCLHDLLLLLESTSIDLIDIFAVGDFLLAAIRVFLILTIKQQYVISFEISLPEDGSDFVIKSLTTIAHIEDLKGLFNCHASLEGLIVH
jgi:hypothetical protein